MGAPVSRCLRCFHFRRQPTSTVTDPLSETVPLHSEDRSFASNSGIELGLLDSQVLTLQALEVAYKATVELVQSEDLDQLVDSGNVKVSGKVSERGYFLRTESETVVGKEKVVEFFNRAEHRPTWDTNMEACRVISQGEYTVVYQLFKKVLAVSPRDMVLAAKLFSQGQALLVVSTSIETPECPPKDNVIRARVYSGGLWVETTEQGLTRIVLVTEIDFGGVIPKSVMLRMSAINMPPYIKALTQALLKDASI